MGMFDSVFVTCPHCGVENELQTKDGRCILGKYDLINAPPQVLLGIEGTHECEYRKYDKDSHCMVNVGCEQDFEIKVQCITKAWVEH